MLAIFFRFYTVNGIIVRRYTKYAIIKTYFRRNNMKNYMSEFRMQQGKTTAGLPVYLLSPIAPSWNRRRVFRASLPQQNIIAPPA